MQVCFAREASGVHSLKPVLAKYSSLFEYVEFYVMMELSMASDRMAWRDVDLNRLVDKINASALQTPPAFCAPSIF